MAPRRSRINAYQLPQKDGSERWVADIPDPRKGGKRSRVVLLKKRDGVPPSKQSEGRANQRLEEIQAQWAREAETGNPDLPTRHTLSSFLDLVTSDPGKPKGGATELSPESVIRRDGVLKKFTAFCEDQGLRYADEIDKAIVDAYRTSLGADGLSAASVRTELARLRRAFNYAATEAPKAKRMPKEWEVPRVDGTVESDAEREESVEDKTLSDAEIDAIFRAFEEGYEVPQDRKREGSSRDRDRVRHPDPDLYPLFVLANQTGMRPNELRLLKWSSVDLEKGLIQIRADSSKKTASAGRRRIPLSPTLMALLREMRPRAKSVYVITISGRPVLDPTDRILMNRKIRRLFDAIGARGKTLYGFRHAFAFRCANNGLPIHKLMTLMGHKRIATTSMYLQGVTDDDEAVMLRAMTG